MKDINRILKNVIPEKILDYKFEEMLFTTEILDIYYIIDGRKSLVDISDQLSIDLVKLIEQIKRMRQMGIVKVQKINQDEKSPVSEIKA